MATIRGVNTPIHGSPTTMVVKLKGRGYYYVQPGRNYEDVHGYVTIDRKRYELHIPGGVYAYAFVSRHDVSGRHEYTVEDFYGPKGGSDRLRHPRGRAARRDTSKKIHVKAHTRRLPK